MPTTAKAEFLKRFEKDYGNPDAPKSIDEIRDSEFKRLEGLLLSLWSIIGLTYLDHAEATLYSEAQMEAVAKDLTSHVYGNPHHMDLVAFVFLFYRLLCQSERFKHRNFRHHCCSTAAGP